MSNCESKIFCSPYHVVTETESKEELHNPWESQGHRRPVLWSNLVQGIVWWRAQKLDYGQSRWITRRDKAEFHAGCWLLWLWAVCFCVCWDKTYTFKIYCRSQCDLVQDLSHVLVCKEGRDNGDTEVARARTNVWDFLHWLKGVLSVSTNLHRCGTSSGISCAVSLFLMCTAPAFAFSRM